MSDAPAIIAGGTSPFVEMRVEGGSALTESEQASKLHEFDRLSNNTLSAPVNPPSCRLIFRDLALEFPASINAAALASFVAVLREGAPS
ncbi:hypothetical protein [Palleronia aestuarii]|uniref:hypothetical protein n=1 Tax=Palleronia aestuarii TaxID=568105 RepID=UPI001B88586C|nr:hypothetical protein [Palleronia aestuarii]